jgi:hypothetical protein
MRFVGLLVLSGALASAQPAARPDDALLDALVFGTHASMDASAYSGELRNEFDAYLTRAAAYRSTTPVPASPGLLRLVNSARVSYERRLAAIADDPVAPNLAAKYVARLRPCYEWEGYHDCPEREALFADEYQAADPNGPFSAYLPLLSAHRWLCAAEAFDYEKRPDDSARSRRMYDERIAAALRSPVLLIRTAAERLSVRQRCF